MIYKNKKAQAISNLETFIITIIGITFIIFIGLIVLGELKTTTGTMVDPTTYANATKTIVVDSFTEFGECIPDEAMSVSWLTNGSDTNLCYLMPGNYTIILNTINVSDDALGGCAGVDTSINLTYSCRNPSVAYNATGLNITKLATVPTWIGIIIVVSLAMIILGFFYSRR